MRLEDKEVKEVAEEIAGGKSESPLKVCEENDPFTRFGDRDKFFSGSSANDLEGDSVGAEQPVQVYLTDIRALPTAWDWFSHNRI